MFVYSMRAGTVRFFGVVAAALAVLFCLFAFVPELQPVYAADSEGEEGTGSISFEGVRSNEERIAFLSQLGWTVEETPIESTTVTIPREFDKVFASYNELQRKEGLDLSGYAGKTVERYTYTVKDYPEYTGTVYANLLIYRGRVIGGDVCSADSTGFLHGLSGKK